MNRNHLLCAFAMVLAVGLIIAMVFLRKESFEKMSSFSTPIGLLLTTKQNVEGNFTKLQLDSVLDSISPGENIVISSTDNDLSNRKGLENSLDVTKEIIPYIELVIHKKGLKVAKNPFDGMYILRPYNDNNQAYPTGYWLSIVDTNSVY